jgi:ribonuclease E
MASNKMLIDASHPEETRVVVQRGNRLEEFDFESALRKQLRGNIYLAKVTRVEPSLQAAFVEYGGNRHGFLAFSEIHPDYYQIPVADRQALLAEQEQLADEDEDEQGSEEGGRRNKRGRRRRGNARPKAAANGESISEETADGSASEASEASNDQNDEAAADHETAEAEAEQPEASAEEASENREPATEEEAAEEAEAEAAKAEVEQLGDSDAMEDMREQRRSFRPRRVYKIQEVIKRRQILLVQVVKEERGNKGAALTTYLSLAGRYSVLMPNTARGGGVSRKITNSADRRRLKDLTSDLDVPQGMGVILRTAGASRTTEEIRRDFEYLLRVWEQVRETTLASVAPTLVYEEGSLIKRSLRDLYGKEVEEVVVSGEAGYREAKDFMKMLMPSQVKSIKAHREPQPLFAKYGVEGQLDAMFSNTVTLKSGGYIVINPTEALVSIDVNSGRSTREHNIEDTAIKTNLEAAEEVARQLRLRDLAGLIVIDFIDMEEHRNNRSVEKRLKDCLKSDRARIQVGRISPFGLLEMSRQRMRTGVLESSTIICPHCGGSGFVRSTSSVALLVLRGIEEALMRNSAFNLIVKTRTEIILYILNNKRSTLGDLEKRFGAAVAFAADDTLHGKNYFAIERGEPSTQVGQPTADTIIEQEDDEPSEISDGETDPNETFVEESSGETQEDRGEDRGRGRRRRRRGRGRDRDDRPNDRGDRPQAMTPDASGADEAREGDDTEQSDEAAERGMTEEERGERRRRRRGRRGGRRSRRDGEPHLPHSAEANEEAGDQDSGEAVQLTEEPVAAVPVVEAVEEKKPRGRRKAKAEEAVEAPAAAPEVAPEIAAPPAKRGRAKKATKADEAVVEAAAPQAKVAAPEIKAAPAAPVQARVVEIEPEIEDNTRPKRAGWWSRAKKAVTGE